MGNGRDRKLGFPLSRGGAVLTEKPAIWVPTERAFRQSKQPVGEMTHHEGICVKWTKSQQPRELTG